MTVHVPGFPTACSDAIDLPDIGELLMYPAFQGINADDFLKYATEFQRYLFYKVPVKNDKKNVLIRSGVWLLEPGTRSHVKTLGDWHIDGDSDDAHIRPDHRVFILSSPCSALTEFNLNPLEVASDPSETRRAFFNRISQDPGKFGIIERKIEPCRIYAFENHLHRAVDPKRIEFRFFLRVRETDMPAFETGPVKTQSLRSVAGTERLHMEYGSDKLSIYYPECMRSRA